ncbi:MAG: ubiquinol oxidase subunit II [Gammaproteobacteria bacterium]|nr:MAG: ubiquinol oxidase subunit II [Gammaproteobacteria bacterium]
MKMKKTISGAMLLLTALLLGGCDFALFAPEGEIGINIRNTMFITVGTMLLVVIPTLFLTVYFAFKYRKGADAEYEPEWEHSNKIELFAWGIPIAIIVVLATITYIATHRLDPRQPIKSDKAPLTIQVVALDWKWLFIYPEEQIATINEIAVPVDRPVEFLITSNSTMNSFFIPRLGGQLYAMAGMENRLNLVANKVGVYRGISSNYSGFGFTGMRFAVHSVPDAKFGEWVAKVKTSPQKLDAESYARLEQRSRDHKVEYFGQIDPLQFKNVIEKYNPVNAGKVVKAKKIEHEEEK